MCNKHCNSECELCKEARQDREVRPACPLCLDNFDVEESGLPRQPYFCMTCEYYFSPDAVVRMYFPEDREEQQHALDTLNNDPHTRIIYRGFEVVGHVYHSTKDETIKFIDWNASREGHTYSFIAPSLRSLLHIIFIITKD